MAKAILDVLVVGLAYHDFPIVERFLCSGLALELRRDPGNANDPNAIAVEVPASRIAAPAQGKPSFMLGYVLATQAQRLAPLLDRGIVPSAEPLKVKLGRNGSAHSLMVRLTSEGLEAMPSARVIGTVEAPKRTPGNARIDIWL